MLQQDIANMALCLCSPFGATISGQAISVDGGMGGWFSGRIERS